MLDTIIEGHIKGNAELPTTCFNKDGEKLIERIKITVGLQKGLDYIMPVSGCFLSHKRWRPSFSRGERVSSTN